MQTHFLYQDVTKPNRVRVLSYLHWLARMNGNSVVTFHLPGAAKALAPMTKDLIRDFVYSFFTNGELTEVSFFKLGVKARLKRAQTDAEIDPENKEA